MRLQLIAWATLSAVFAAFAWVAVQQWWVGWSSDYALIGLIAQHFAETGHFSWMVPTVGYQGLLWTESLAALCFLIAGKASPAVLHISAAITHALFLATSVWFLRKAFPALIALAITGLALVSSGLWHEMLFRTQPNYAETFTLGLLALGFYQQWVKSGARRDAVIWGGAAGFGLYTYGQIVFFLVPIALDLLMHQRERWSATRVPWLPQPLKNTWVRCALAIALICVPMFLGGWVDGQIGPWKFGLRIRSYLAIAAVFWGVGQLTGWEGQFAKWKREARLWISRLRPAILAAAVGYSPTWIYRYVVGGHSDARMKTIIGVPQLIDHIEIFGQAQRHFFSVPESVPAWGVALVAATHWGGWLWVACRYRRDFPPLTWALGWVTLALFFLSDNVIDIYSIRYLTWFFWLFALAWGVAALRLRGPSRAVFVGITCVVVALRVSWLGAFWFPAQEPKFLSTMRDLESRGITAGRADYWTAYVVTFSSESRVVLQPESSDYLPWIRDEVARRLAVPQEGSR